MEQLIYEVNGKKYLLFEIPVTARTQQKFMKTVEDCEGILQGVKDINRGGWLSDAYMVCRALIPEGRIDEFNKSNK